MPWRVLSITNNKLHSSIDYLLPREFRRKSLNGKSFREGYIKRMDTKLNE
ncbi:MAG: hypothetical protein QXR21_05930 [Thermoplasmatales archaeon]